MEEFEKLLEEAKERDIEIMLIWYVNHTSTEHEWFKKAKDDKKVITIIYIFRKG